MSETTRLAWKFSGRVRLFVGLYLVALVVIVAFSSLDLPVNVSIGFVDSSLAGLGMLGLILGIAVVASRNLESLRTLEIIFALGSSAALVSGLHTVGTTAPAGVCAVLTYRSGFPFPWLVFHRFQLNTTGPLCLLPSPVPPRIDLALLLLDLAFYLGACIAILELTRAASLSTRKQTPNQSQIRHPRIWSRGRQDRPILALRPF